jgi:ribosomal protein S18 acetylase RimI-like enzyme
VKVHTHRATLDDDRALAVLDAQAWPPELWVVTPQDADEPFFGPRREPQDVIVATLDGAVVGYARIGRHMAIAANDHVLHLEALAVSPAARGMGVGSLVIELTIAEAFSRGARKLGLRGAVDQRARDPALRAGRVPRRGPAQRRNSPARWQLRR